MVARGWGKEGMCSHSSYVYSVIMKRGQDVECRSERIWDPEVAFYCSANPTCPQSLNEGSPGRGCASTCWLPFSTEAVLEESD